MLRIRQLKLPVEHSRRDLEQKIIKTLRIRPEELIRYELIRRSLDARGGELKYVYMIDAEVKREPTVLKHCNGHAEKAVRTWYQFPKASVEAKKMQGRPVIIGAGPAGLFCGWMLAKAGYAPLVLERGEKAEDRARTVEHFWLTGELNERSNVQFGEGGAGTFSDGKLNTLVKDPVGRNRKVLELFVEAGADEEILYEQKPHLGTDELIGIVTYIRKEIERLGGEVRFHCQMTDLLIQNGQIHGVQTTDLRTGEMEEIAAGQVVLAVGHSARDTFSMLKTRQIPMRAKPFAVGVRMEHPQEMINFSQYGAAHVSSLGAASYKLTHQAENGRGVYSFCMCPGGFVVNASSEKGGLAVNGMSYHARDSKNANSALIVTVTPQDFPDASYMGGVAFQRRLEQAAYSAGNSKIPLQLFGDFKEGRISTGLGEVKPCTKGAYAFADLNQVLPKPLTEALCEAIPAFDRKIHGFAREDALLLGVESRTSSPLRMVRDENGESNVRGLYPCGEGAGYAGGITSAAMDGIRAAEWIAARFCP